MQACAAKIHHTLQGMLVEAMTMFAAVEAARPAVTMTATGIACALVLQFSA